MRKNYTLNFFPPSWEDIEDSFYGETQQEDFGLGSTTHRRRHQVFSVETTVTVVLLDFKNGSSFVYNCESRDCRIALERSQIVQRREVQLTE